jgi:hypothetical protein
MSQLHSLKYSAAKYKGDPLTQIAPATQLTRLEVTTHREHPLQLAALSSLAALRCCRIEHAGDAGWYGYSHSFRLHAAQLSWMTQLTELRLELPDQGGQLEWADVAAVAAAGHWSGLRSLKLANDEWKLGEGPLPLARLDHLTRLMVEGPSLFNGMPHDCFHNVMRSWRLPALAVLEVHTMWNAADGGPDSDGEARWRPPLARIMKQGAVAPGLVSIKYPYSVA